MRLVSAAEMAEIDDAAQQEYGLPALVLMENAGIKCFSRIKAIVSDLQTNNSDRRRIKLVVVCGKGSNAGDGFVIARQAFLDGFEGTEIVTAQGDVAGTAGTMAASCRALGVPFYDWSTDGGLVRRKIEQAELVVDCLTGTGVKGRLRPPLGEIALAINESARPVVSIDLPSGIGDGFKTTFPAVRAHHTLTIELPKRSMYLPAARPYCGTISVVPIGFPPELVTATGADAALLDVRQLPGLLPRVDPAGHKKTRGTVAVFAGSRGLTGAAVLAAEAASRSLAGLVVVHADSDIYDILASRLVGEIVRPFDYNHGTAAVKDFSSVVLGPGWGRSSEKHKLIESLVREGKTGVLDADALNLLADGPLPDFGGRWILTPHPGEFSRLVRLPTAEILEDPVPHLADFAASHNVYVVLKAHVSYIVCPSGRYYVADGMNAALATGGSGDVLSGCIGGLLAAGADPEAAACAGVLAHGETGTRLFRAEGWFSASGLPRVLGKVLAGE